MDLEAALGDLQTQDYFVWDDFLSQAEVKNIAADYEILFSSGAFKLAGTGNQAGSQKLNASIRSDQTYWLEPLALTPAQRVFWERLEILKKEINERFFLGLWNLDGHYSHYPVGGHYQTHLDRFHSDDRRTISMVLYFNSAWIKADGGELRFHFPNAEIKTLDIAPMSGRLVCFLSDKILHEVLTAQRPRLSFAGWWMRRAH